MGVEEAVRELCGEGGADLMGCGFQAFGDLWECLEPQGFERLGDEKFVLSF